MCGLPKTGRQPSPLGVTGHREALHSSFFPSFQDLHFKAGSNNRINSLFLWISSLGKDGMDTDPLAPVSSDCTTGGQASKVACVSAEVERWCEGQETPSKAERPPRRLRSSPEQPWGAGPGLYLWLLNSFMISRKPL